jgi:flavin-dependent dehydrogenase
MSSIDVVIAGAGPAGSLAALLLARRGARVTIVERTRFPRPKLCGDTLNPGAVGLLARHVPLDGLVSGSLAIRGMRLTGPGSVEVRGDYGPGVHGLSVTRQVFDGWLLERALESGARLVEATAVLGPRLDGRGAVAGVVTRGSSGTPAEFAAPMTIGADGRRSRLAAGRLSWYAASPRRWAIGAYYDAVSGLGDVGEMHIRTGHYLGVAPVPGGRANACLVRPLARGERWADPGALLDRMVSTDPLLGPRFRTARRVSRPSMLGPMAVETPVPGCPGLLLAGDAAGFVDPMTGDGIRLALSGAELAATVAADVLEGRTSPAQAAARLATLRRRALDGKRRFNRALRRLVAFPAGVRGAALTARVCPAVFAALIRHAGDCAVRLE